MDNMELPKYQMSWKAGFYMLISFLVLQIAIVILLKFLGKIGLIISQDISDIINILTMWISVILSYNFFICKPQTGQNIRFDLSVKDVTTYLIIFPMMFGMMMIGNVTVSLIPTEGYFFGELYRIINEMSESISDNNLTTIFLVSIVAPVCEEIVFRGIIQKGLINRGVSPLKAVVFSAVLFGIIHGNPWQLVAGILLGVVLGWVYEKTNSLLSSIMLHIFNNLFYVLLMIYSKSDYFSDLLGISQIYIYVIGLGIFLIFLYLFNKKYK